jgi:1-acyl-sn-glycerol-3-phosphate acyltransferase
VAARLRFFALWVAQVARTLADTCLVIFAVSQLSKSLRDSESGLALWIQALTLYGLPFLVLAPVAGWLAGRYRRGSVLVGATAWCLIVATLVSANQVRLARPDSWAWYLVLFLLGGGAAVQRTAGDASLPAVAQKTRLPLGRVIGWFTAGSAITFADALVWSWGFLHGFFPRTLFLPFVLGVNGLALLAGIAAQDLLGRDSNSEASITIGTLNKSSPLLGLVCLWGILVGASTAWLCSLPWISFPRDSDPRFAPIMLMSLGILLASPFAGLQNVARRGVGLLPFAALGAAMALWKLAGEPEKFWPHIALGASAGLASVPLWLAWQDRAPAEARGPAMALANAASSGAAIVLALLVTYLITSRVLTPTNLHRILAGLAVVAFVVSARLLLRPILEQILEVLLWPFYRIRARGPGVGQIPKQGPLLIVANHAAWLDPLWLGKVIPRRLIPMMTSRYYDLPVLHWLMINAGHAIRVPAAKFRREAPELVDAVAALDRGEALLIFPEGSMRRREETNLRHFGQGVWRILHDRPETPVLIAWIEGNWGSFTSYRGGPPGRGKRLDLWRRIDIALEVPRVLDAEMLADQRATRECLMRACLETRRYLGLEPLPAVFEPADENEN